MSHTPQTSRDYKPSSSLTDRNTKVQPSTTNANTKAVVRSGTADVRSERSTFRAATWKPCKLELDGEALTIINPSSSKRTRIPLGAIMELERTDLAAHALAVRIRATLSSRPPSQSANTTKTTTVVIGFASDSELYDWQDDLYTRSPLGSYSSGPFGFVHKAHVGVDISGNYLSTGDTSILPLYAEIIGGGGAQPSLAASPNQSVASGAKLPRSRPVSGVVVLPKITTSLAPTKDTPTTNAAPTSSSPKTTTSSKMKAGLLEGQCIVQKPGAGMLKRWLAKPVWVSLNLTEAKLVIHRSAEKTSPAARTIPLTYFIQARLIARKTNWLILDMKENKSVMLMFATENEPRAWGEALFGFAKARNADQDKSKEKETSQKKFSGSAEVSEKTRQKQEKTKKRRSVPLGTPVGA